MLEGCGRDTGWHHEPDAEFCALGSVDHVLQTPLAADIDDLVGIGENGGGAVGHQHPAELLRTDVGTFNVDVAVDEPRRGI